MVVPRLLTPLLLVAACGTSPDTGDDIRAGMSAAELVLALGEPDRMEYVDTGVRGYWNGEVVGLQLTYGKGENAQSYTFAIVPSGPGHADLVGQTALMSWTR